MMHVTVKEFQYDGCTELIEQYAKDHRARVTAMTFVPDGVHAYVLVAFEHERVAFEDPGAKPRTRV